MPLIPNLIQESILFIMLIAVINQITQKQFKRLFEITSFYIINNIKSIY